ncbi:MAG: hypothetical protein LBP69_06780, partial [Treponema sp.]|nr:hypothetical protein [Treponema sp.]
EKIRKNHDLWGCFGSLQGKKSPCGRFLEVLCAKRNKLLGELSLTLRVTVRLTQAASPHGDTAAFYRGCHGI